MKNTASAAESFDRFFQIVAVDGPDLLDEVHRIRYEVYCKEFQYEREEDCPGQREKDEYDALARHCLLLHKPSNQFAGCTRLVYPDRAGQKPLPFERFCGDSLDRDKIRALGAQEPGTYGEFSRLAVTSTFRRRKSDEQKPFSLTQQDLQASSNGRSPIPLIPVSMFLASLSMFMDSDLRFAFAMMEPRLARLLKRFGIIFTRVGKIMDYHGPRGPFVLAREDVTTYMEPEIQELMNDIARQLARRDRPENAP